MKTIGLVGGTSWASTMDYYRYINELTNERLGGNEYARCIIYSLNYGDIVKLNAADDVKGLEIIFSDAVRRLEQGGAEILMLGANTMHRFADYLQQRTKLPMVHIAEATGAAILEKKLRKVALLGTKFTMELDFYKDKLAAMGIETIVPEAAERSFIHNNINEELSRLVIRDETRNKYLDIINQLINRGAEGVILGCTEIPLLIKQEHVKVPVFDTAYIHAKAGVEFALS